MNAEEVKSKKLRVGGVSRHVKAPLFLTVEDTLTMQEGHPSCYVHSQRELDVDVNTVMVILDHIRQGT